MKFHNREYAGAGSPHGVSFYNGVRSQVANAPSNAALVSGQLASANLNGVTSQTVTLNGVTAGNSIAVAFGYRSPNTTGASGTPTDSQSQTITVLVHDDSSTSGGAGVHSQISILSGAKAGTHTITVSTTDTSASGEVLIYELSGVQSWVTGSAHSQVVATLALASAINCPGGSVSIGAAGAAPVGGVGASLVWSGSGTQGSLTADATDANFCGIEGHASVAVGGAAKTQDFGVNRQGTGTPTGLSVCGAVFQ